MSVLRGEDHGRKADWTAWNQALAVIWLIGVPDVIDAAAAMDRVFWTDGTRIKTGQITDDDAWAVARGRMSPRGWTSSMLPAETLSVPSYP